MNLPSDLTYEASRKTETELEQARELAEALAADDDARTQAEFDAGWADATGEDAYKAAQDRKAVDQEELDAAAALAEQEVEEPLYGPGCQYDSPEAAAADQEAECRAERRNEAALYGYECEDGWH